MANSSATSMRWLTAALMGVAALVLVFSTPAHAVERSCVEGSTGGLLSLVCNAGSELSGERLAGFFQDGDGDDSYVPPDPAPVDSAGDDTGDTDGRDRDRGSAGSDSDRGGSDDDEAGAGNADEELDGDGTGRGRDAKSGSVGDGGGSGLSNVQLVLAMLASTAVGSVFFTAARRVQRGGLDL